MRIVEVEFDGGHGNGLTTFGYVLKYDGKEITGHGKIANDDRMTNNIAEYLGLLKAIKRFKLEVKNHSDYEMMIYGDSRLVIEHVGKRWGWSKAKVRWNPHNKEPHLKTMLFKVLEELDGIHYQSVWVRRNKNSQADALSRVPRG